MLQLYNDQLKCPALSCIYVSMLGSDSANDILLKRAGIDLNSRKVEPGGFCDVPIDKTVVIIMLDDAQNKYSDTDFWTSLIKTDNDLPNSPRLPPNIYFIISATYSLNTVESLVNFTDLPKLTMQDFVLNTAEAADYLNLWLDDPTVGEVLRDHNVREMISMNCGGHMGALSVSVKKLRDKFFKCSSISTEEVVSFYLSKPAASEFQRCFASGVTMVPEELRKLLFRCLCDKEAVVFDETNVSSEEGKAACRQLVRSGVLVLTGDLKVQFSSPIASRFINNLIFPHRALQYPRDVVSLVEMAIARMSATALENSLADPENGFPSDTTFQHHILEGLQCHTPVNCCILPELSTLLPTINPGGISSSTSPSSPRKVRGRCDFYINGELRWLVELLVNGNAVGGEHLSRMERGGKYVGLRFLQYLVVDFRGNKSGRPTAVKRSANRMTVFFKLGDYSHCQVLHGLDGAPKNIRLEN